MKCRGKLLKLEQSGVNHPLYKSGKSIKQDYTCQSCNNTFVSDKGYEGRNIKFCSKKCAGKSMTVKRPVNKCCQCGDNFISKYLQGIHKFCSISCAAIYNGNKARGVKRPEMSGEKSPFWRGGVTPENELQRKGIDYKKWRTDVFKRDNYTCQHCGQVGGKLNADHIKPFAYFKELRFDINNGRTLCVNCHKKTDNYGGRARKLDPSLTIKKNGHAI